jgi:Xaa-Pro aminopeptidase
MTGREGDALAREVIAARGFGDAFGHSLGTGWGWRFTRLLAWPRRRRACSRPTR